VIAAPEPEEQDGAGRGLSGKELRLLALLGLPTFGLALSITVVSTYLPTVARQFTASTTIIGLLIGGEGLGAVALPIVVGVWSDRLRTRWDGRLPFVAIGAPIAAAGLVAMGFVGSLTGIAVAVAIFFVGYFVAYEPYRALYPDLVPDEVAGRAQSTQAIWRGSGTGLALLGGGLLLALGQAAPFTVSALVLLAAVASFVWLMGRTPRPEQRHSSMRVGETIREMTGVLLHDPPLRAFFCANALWELSLGALKTFVILWMTRGLGLKLGTASLIVGGAALLILVGAATSGRLADRFGQHRVVFWSVLAFGLPMAIPLLSTSHPLIVASGPCIALGGGVLMSLPFALLQPLMPADRHGALTGYYSVSRGLGVMLGPLLGGVAVSAASGLLDATQGYAAMWAVCGVAALASLPLIAEIR
jgi:MFS family permease